MDASLSFIILWGLSGFMGAGYIYAYSKAVFNLNDSFEDIVCPILALLGPLVLVISLFMTKFGYYGWWMFKRK